MQEVIQFTLPVTGKQVIIKGYTTGRDEQLISAALQEKMSVEIGPSGQPQTTIPGTAEIAATNKGYELLVLSIDNDSNDILNRVLDLPAEDTRFIKAQINKMTKAASFTEEKKSESLDKPSSLPPVQPPA